MTILWQYVTIIKWVGNNYILFNGGMKGQNYTRLTKSVEQQKMTIEITTKQTFLLERNWTRNSNK